MLLAYDFEPSATVFVNTVATIPYCFHIALPVRTGIATFRQAHISTNTASFSSPVAPCPQGYFHADPKDRIFVLEVTDNNWMQGMEETTELYAPVRTFLAYIAAHPPAAVAASARGPINVPWEAWGPYGAHLVRAHQPYIIRRPRACGMRVLGACLGKESVVVADYHPGRVARSASLDAAARVRARALNTFSENSRGTQMRHAPLVCATKEVPLPRELQEASESPWTMLCEDALLAFEVSCRGGVCYIISGPY
jgi:hypothetical protein